MPNTAYIALGGNLGPVLSNMRSSVSLLTSPGDLVLLRVSSVYKTAPVNGPSGQPDYLNAVAAFATELLPEQVVVRCLEAESALGRVRGVRWGPRTIDLDLVLLGNIVGNEPDAVVPHPRFRERLFVLMPLKEITPPEFRLPPEGVLLDDILGEALAQASETLVGYRRQIVNSPTWAPKPGDRL